MINAVWRVGFCDTCYSRTCIRTNVFRTSSDWPRSVSTHSRYDSSFGRLTFPIACVIHAQDYKAVVEHSCKIFFAYRFNSELIRIPLAAPASGHCQLDAFIASTFQKAMLCEVWFSDLAFSHTEQIKWNSSKRRFFNSAVAAKSEYDEWEGEDDTSADLNQTQVDILGSP